MSVKWCRDPSGNRRRKQEVQDPVDGECAAEVRVRPAAIIQPNHYAGLTMPAAAPRRKYAIWLSLVLLLTIAFRVTAQQTVPDWTLESATGTPLNFYAHSAGRPAVLLFWATWCPYCRELMPALETVREEFAAGDVTFYALNIWEDGDPVAYLREQGYGFELLLGADAVAAQYGVKGTPGLLVVDAARRVVYVRKSGTSPAQVARDLRAILAQVIPAPQ